MRISARLLTACLLIAVFTLFLGAGQAAAAKNVILMIGDGMGVGQANAGSYYLTGGAGGLCFQPYYRGTVRTNSLNGTTDSAAAGTALATGHKTNNGVVSQSPTGTTYTTIMEKAKAAGKSTGLVTTCFSYDATPAAFGSHVSDRGNYSGIVS
jgi:alkaline phosphatase